ncbi:MAG: hypothetical protein GWM89_01270, partial [Candidatus Dadabacteria bacterium]|nr:hypothetical protein [Candidatus Dadabacteria bacterium]NIY21065.1 hypothetical protein [Candidatus Dadabacteria bacterium]
MKTRRINSKKKLDGNNKFSEFNIASSFNRFGKSKKNGNVDMKSSKTGKNDTDDKEFEQFMVNDELVNVDEEQFSAEMQAIEKEDKKAEKNNQHWKPDEEFRLLQVY